MWRDLFSMKTQLFRESQRARQTCVFRETKPYDISSLVLYVALKLHT